MVLQLFFGELISTSHNNNVIVVSQLTVKAFWPAVVVGG